MLAAFGAALAPVAATGAETEAAPSAPVAIPDTPAGRRFAWMIEARGQFAPEQFGDMTITVRILRLAREALAPVTRVGFREPMRDRAIGALLRDRTGGQPSAFVPVLVQNAPLPGVRSGSSRRATSVTS